MGLLVVNMLLEASAAAGGICGLCGECCCGDWPREGDGVSIIQGNVMGSNTGKCSEYDF